MESGAQLRVSISVSSAAESLTWVLTTASASPTAGLTLRCETISTTKMNPPPSACDSGAMMCDVFEGPDPGRIVTRYQPDPRMTPVALALPKVGRLVMYDITVTARELAPKLKAAAHRPLLECLGGVTDMVTHIARTTILLIVHQILARYKNISLVWGHSTEGISLGLSSSVSRNRRSYPFFVPILLSHTHFSAQCHTWQTTEPTGTQ